MDRLFEAILVHEEAMPGLILEALVFVTHQALLVQIVRRQTAHLKHQ
jgi:hypothetical protein